MRLKDIYDWIVHGQWGVHCRSLQASSGIIQKPKGKSIKRKTEAEKELA